MGCGQSKIGNIYPKNKKNKSSAKKNGSASIEQKNGNGKSTKTNNNGPEVNRNEDQNGPLDIKSQAKKKPATPGSGPLLQQAEVSSSQLDFFKMLDEKIENGPDYDENTDVVPTAERVSGLLRRWELASVSWSSVTDLNVSPSALKNSRSALSTSRQSLSAKDREGMRNIIGGRPESAPVSIRNANRVDGLQESHCPSPSMPRHVLESITQSPTQSLRNSPPGMSPTSLRYQEYNANQSPIKRTKIQYQVPSQVYQSTANREYVTQQQLFLQEAGIVAAQYSPSSPGGNALRNNPYVQQFQISSPQHFPAPRKRGFNAAQMT